MFRTHILFLVGLVAGNASLLYFTDGVCRSASVARYETSGYCAPVPDGQVRSAELTITGGCLQAYGGGQCGSYLGSFCTSTCIGITESITGFTFVPEAQDISAIQQDTNSVHKEVARSNQNDVGSQLISTDDAHEKRLLQLLRLVGILYSAKTLFDGMDGLANACINGDWTSTKSSIAAGTACVTNAFRIVMGAVMAQKTYVGQITNPFTQTKRGILDAIDLEAFTSQIDQSTWMGSFDLATFAHPVVMVLTDTITQDAHVVQYWFDEHTHQHTVSHKLDSSGEGSPSLHKRAGALNVFFSWTEADSNEEALANDDQDLSSIASMMFDDLNNNQQSAEACFSVCDNTAEVVTGYLGAYEENSMPEPQTCSNMC